MGFGTDGRDLLYGLEIARAKAPGTTKIFPTAIVSLQVSYRQPVAEHQNMAGDERQSFIKLYAPDCQITLEGITETELEFWRALHGNAGDFYILKLFRSVRFIAQDSVSREPSVGVFKCTVPHSSMTLGSKRAVDAGGNSLLSAMRIYGTWSEAMEDSPTAPNFFASYSDTLEEATLGGGPPPSGASVWVNFSCFGWLAKPKPGALTATRMVGSEGLYDVSMMFVAA
jgi:hypothetical protein